jgi:serine/threonine-protein kinase
VIHRDLKPSNLLQGINPANPEEPPILKLTDFGIASLFASPHLTVTGGVIGTPEYLSPEQASGKPVTRRSDLYSLGVVLYTLITGTTPFVGDQIVLLQKHQFGQFDRPSRIIEDLPHDFDEIICDLLEKDPARRPADGGVLFRRLDALRKKLLRQAEGNAQEKKPQAFATAPNQSSTSDGREGPATFVSRMVRQELENQNRGGPIQRFLNNPIVLVILFVLCVGTLVSVFWPSSPETLFRRGSELMASNDPEERDRAWERYLDPLERKYPDHPYQEEVARLREKYEADLAERKAGSAAPRLRGRLGEAQWFYEKGMRLRREGDEAEAKKTWEAMIAAFKGPGDLPWVRRAEAELKKAAGALDDAEWRSLQAALEGAAKLRREGKRAESEAIRAGLRALYHDQPRALAIINKR